MRSLPLFVFFCFIFSFCSPKKKTGKEPNPIDGSIVLNVGEVSITAYELQKNYNIFKQSFVNQHNRAPSKAESDAWLEDYKGRAYFLADAEAKGYYDSEEIEKTVRSMEGVILFQPGGLLEQKLLASLTPDAVKAQVEESKKQVHLQYIKFPDKVTGEKILAEAGGNDWPTMQTKALKANATSGRDTYQWPFSSLWSESKSIAGLRKGQTSSLVKIIDNYYLVHVDNITYLPKPMLDEKQMYGKLKQDILKKYYDRIQEQSRFSLNDEGVSKMAGKIRVLGAVNTLDPRHFTDMLQTNLASFYQPGGQKKQVSVAELIAYYNRLPVRTLIENPGSIKNYLSSMAYDSHMRKDADKLGLTSDPKFILDRKNFKNTLVYNNYEQSLLNEPFTVPESDLAKAYESMKEKLRAPTEIAYSMYLFSSREEAFQSKLKIQMTKNADTTTLPGVKESKRHQRLDFRSTQLADTLKKALFQMKPQQVSFPIQMNRQFVLLVKEGESGSRIQSLEEVRPLLIKDLRDRKSASIKQAKLTQLKKMYKEDERLNDVAFFEAK